MPVEIFDCKNRVALLLRKFESRSTGCIATILEHVHKTSPLAAANRHARCTLLQRLLAEVLLRDISPKKTDDRSCQKASSSFKRNLWQICHLEVKHLSFESTPIYTLNLVSTNRIGCRVLVLIIISDLAVSCVVYLFPKRPQGASHF